MKLVKYFFIGIVVLCAAWSGAWFALQKQVDSRVSQVRENLEIEGGEVEAFSYTVSGFPFCFDIKFDSLALKGGKDLFNLLTEQLGPKRAFFWDMKQLVEVLNPEIAVHTEDLTVSSYFWSPFSQKVSCPNLAYSLKLQDLPSSDASIEGMEMTFAKGGLKSFSYASSQSKLENVSFFSSGMSLQRLSSDLTSFHIAPLEVQVVVPETKSKIELHLGKGEGTWDSKEFGELNLTYHDLTYAFENLFPEYPSVHFGCKTFKWWDTSEEKQEKMVFEGLRLVEGVHVALLDQEGNKEKYQVDELRLSGQTSCLAKKWKDYRNINWLTLLEKWKGLALERVQSGKVNIPELKNLILELEEAKFEIALDFNLIYQGQESSFNIDAHLKDEFLEGRSSLKVAKVFLPFLSEKMGAQGLLNDLEFYELKGELKDRILLYAGMPVQKFSAIEWESLPILTEDFCAEFLQLEREKYREYTATPSALDLSDSQVVDNK